MHKISAISLVGAAIFGIGGVTLWAYGLMIGAGASNAWTELGSALLAATLISLAVIGVEHGLEASQRNKDEVQRAEERNREVRLMIALQPSLRNSDLSNCNLSSIYLSRKDLSRTVLSATSLRNANLESADLSGCRAHESTFAGARAAGVILSEAHVERCDLSAMDLRHARIREAHITYSDLRGVLLTDADCSASDFWESDLRGADLTGVNFSRARGLVAVKFQGARVDTTTKWPREFDIDQVRGLVTYRRAPQSFSTLRDSDWSKTNFTETVIDCSEITNVLFVGSWLRNVDFYDTRVIACDFSRADLSEASGLVGAEFVDCIYDAQTVWPPLSRFDPGSTTGLRSKKGGQPAGE